MRLCLVASIAGLSATATAETITLEDAVDRALRQHPVLARANADREAALARIGQTRAGLLPRVSTTVNIRDDVRDPQNVFDSMPGWGNLLAYDAGLNVDLLLTDSGRTTNRVASVRAAERQARAQIAVEALDIELGVVRAYLDILRGKELVAVSTGAIALVDEQLARATALFKATLRPEIDVLSAETQLAQARLAKVRDENSVATAQVTLQNAIAAPETTAVDAAPVGIAALPDEARTMDELAALALEQRPELAVLRDRIAATEADVRVARKRLSPVLSASTGVFANGGKDYPFGDGIAGGSWAPGVGVFASIGGSMDLYVGGANHYEVREAEAQVRSVRAELERVQQAIRMTVKQSALAVRISREALAVASAWRAQAERQLQLAQARYQNGVGNFVELNDARTGLVSAQRQEVQATYELAQSRVALARELGRAPSGLAATP